MCVSNAASLQVRGFSPNWDFRGFSLNNIDLAERQLLYSILYCIESDTFTWDGERSSIVHVNEPKKTGARSVRRCSAAKFYIIFTGSTFFVSNITSGSCSSVIL
jgi:hypothetical protein